MNKLMYLAIPAGLVVGTSNWEKEEVAPVEEASTSLKHLQQHLSVMHSEKNLDENTEAESSEMVFCGQRIPLEDERVNSRFKKELDKFVFYPAGIRLYHKRALHYKKRFQRILRKHGLPEDLFYVCLAESALQTNAVSPKGAKGFWQFMKTTARAYDLEVSQTVDERFHEEKATEAASRYFKHVHRQFKDWPLVLAAYNMGPTALNKAMKEQGVDNFYDLQLNRETSRYLYRILSIKALLTNPEKYGINLDNDYSGETPTRVLEIESDITDLEAFAQSANCTYTQFKILNPWLISHQLIAKAGKKYEIRLPEEPIPATDSLLTEAIQDFPEDSVMHWDELLGEEVAELVPTLHDE